MNFLEELLRIPHLDLGVQFDRVSLMTDLARALVGHWPADYDSKYLAEDHQGYHKGVWAGLSLVGTTDDPRDGMTESTGEPETPTLMRTTLADLCPHMMQVVHEILGSETLTRLRIMRISPGKNLAWHSHTKEHKQWPVQLTVQVPITMPEGFEYVVTTEDNVKNSIPAEVYDEDRLYRARYEPGRAYVFNSYEYHNVFNPSDENRYTLMFYGNVFTNQHFKGIVERAVEAYDGPLI